MAALCVLRRFSRQSQQCKDEIDTAEAAIAVEFFDQFATGIEVFARVESGALPR